jgi:predicted MFS family arabinose efflux permease
MALNWQRLWPIKLSFLALVAADAVGVSFLPVYARGLAQIWDFLPPEAAAGLPVSVFGLMVAAAQLTVPLWLPERGQRRLTRGALALVALCLGGAALAPSVEALILVRAIAGFAFGVAMILVQDALLRAYPENARTEASGLYLSLFFGGTLAGTLAGGRLAAEIGYPATLAAGAALALAGLIPAGQMPDAREPRRSAVGLGSLRHNSRFLALVLLAAIPSRLVIGAFLYYLIPLHLHDQGFSADRIGWVLMVYGLVLVILATPIARRIDRRNQPFTFTLLSLLGSALAMAMIPVAGGGLAVAAVAVAVAVAVLGLARRWAWPHR